MMRTKKVKFEGKSIRIKLSPESPIFQFKCKCGNIVYQGVADFDMEDDLHCSKCGRHDEAWYFKHTILGTNHWTSGDHYPNDPMTSLTLEEVLGFFFNKRTDTHGSLVGDMKKIIDKCGDEWKIIR